MVSNVIFIILQIVAGIAVAILIYLIALMAIRSNQIVEKDNYNVEKTEVDILDGILNASENVPQVKNNTWNTSLPHAHNYLAVTPSVNNMGGSQFSYSLWMYVGNPKKAVNRNIFLKGDKTPYQYSVQEHSFDEGLQATIPTYEQNKNERVVMCPSFNFGGGELDFEITFNTFHKIDEKMIIKRKKDDQSAYRNNLQSIFARTWFHVTFTFEDNVPINDFEKGILVRFYINGNLYQIEKYASTLRQNRGNFYVFPDETKIADCKIADLKYYNYALTDGEIQNMSKNNNKPPEKSASTSKQEVAKKSVTTNAKNHLDIFNI